MYCLVLGEVNFTWINISLQYQNKLTKEHWNTCGIMYATTCIRIYNIWVYISYCMLPNHACIHVYTNLSDCLSMYQCGMTIATMKLFQEARQLNLGSQILVIYGVNNIWCIRETPHKYFTLLFMNYILPAITLWKWNSCTSEVCALLISRGVLPYLNTMF